MKHTPPSPCHTPPYPSPAHTRPTYSGNHKCNKSVVIGRPRNSSELAALVAAYPRVKAVGVGHSWWAEQFCAGSDEQSINIVMTELQDTLPAFEGKPEQAIFVDEGARSVTVKAGVSQRTLLKYLAKWVEG
jgi:hypothetical protein